MTPNAPRMPEAISRVAFHHLRDFIEQHCGLALGNEQTYLVESRLAGLLTETGCGDYDAFCDLVRSQEDTRLRDRIVDAITTHETSWFRDGHPFAILQERLLPAFAEEFREGRRFQVRIWSAAASTGQEPYSIALAILEYLRTHPACELRPEHFEILATDISPAALFLAESARYDARAIARGLPEPHRRRYFRDEGTAWRLEDTARQMVTIRKFNLQNSPEPLGRFDLAFLRYVTIYFSAPFKRQVYAGMARVLPPGSHLIISPAETLQGISTDFEALAHGGGVYYRRRGA